MLDPARAHPGVPGAAGDLPRPAPRAHRLGAAHPRGVLPPGRPAAERGRVAHRAVSPAADGFRARSTGVPATRASFLNLRVLAGHELQRRTRTLVPRSGSW